MPSTPTFQRIAILAAMAYSCFGSMAVAFVFAPPTLIRRATTPTTTLRKDCSSLSRRAKSFVIILQSSSRDEEIAKLEQQLRELKQQQQGQDDDPTASTLNNDATPSQASVYSDKRKNVVNDRGVREILPGKGMILSEQTLVESQLLDNSGDGSKGLGVIPAIAIGLVAAVGLFFFAQVPVGQDDYMRYSAASTTSSKVIDLGDLNMDISR